MRERVRQFDGHMNIESNQRGTKISFSIPLAETAAPEQLTTMYRVEAAG